MDAQEREGAAHEHRRRSEHEGGHAHACRGQREERGLFAGEGGHVAVAEEREKGEAGQTPETGDALEDGVPDERVPGAIGLASKKPASERQPSHEHGEDGGDGAVIPSSTTDG